jgi:Aminotransferase class-V
MQTRNARSALGGSAIGANSAVLSLHPAGETAELSPPSVFSHLDWLSRIFAHFCSKESLGLGFNLPSISPARVTEELANNNIGVRDGHMYTPRLMKRLGLPVETGAVRASLVHYNTMEEVRRFGSVLAEITSG